MSTKHVWADDAAIDDFLRGQEIGHLTTLDAEGWPHTVAVNYVWHGGNVYFHSGLTGKIDRLRVNPKVSFAVTEPLGLLTSEFTSGPCHDTQMGLSVLIRGLAKEIKSPDRKFSIINKLISKYDPLAAKDPDAERMAPEAIMDQPSFQACQVIEIETVSLTARRSLLDGKPEKYRRAAAAHLQQLGQEKGRERDLKTAVLINQSFDIMKGGDK